MTHACVNLNENEKKEQTFKSLKRELVKVSWDPEWKPEELQNTG
jgi:ribosomal protein S21